MHLFMRNTRIDEHNSLAHLCIDRCSLHVMNAVCAEACRVIPVASQHIELTSHELLYIPQFILEFKKR